MGTIIALVSVLLALIAAGSIAYIAWELTSEDPASGESDSAEDRD